MRLDYQAEILHSFQQERTQQHRAQMAAQARLPQKETAVSRLLRSSGTLLITIGARLQAWSGAENTGTAADAARGVAFR